MDGLQPGDPSQIGPFRLLSRLGEGGMGRVYLGESPGGRKVAIKVVHSHYANDLEFRRRFAREVATARQVGGFHTAAVVGADPDADPPWMATAYIAGPSLAEAVAEGGPLDEAGVRQLGAALAEGLAAIHDCGLIHRDLKPGNVILADDGPRIIDFGIARGTDATDLTASGGVIGTLRYMSPEQLNSQELTPQSDVFALGAVLAYAATGRDPFAAPTLPAAINRILNDGPDLDPLTAGLRAIIGDCLAKDPASRPRPADLITRFSHSEAHDPTVTALPAPVPAPAAVPAKAPAPEPPPAAPSKPARRPAQEPEPPQDSTINVDIAGRQQPAKPRAPRAAAAAPARKPRRRSFEWQTALIAAAVIAVATLIVVNMVSNHSTVNNHPTVKNHPTTALSATGSLARILMGPATAAATVRSVAFAPDGTTLATGDAEGKAYVWNTKTGQVTVTLTDPGSPGSPEDSVDSVAFAPDGITLATGDDQGNTYLWNTRTGQMFATLTAGESGDFVDSVSFASDGTTLATSYSHYQGNNKVGPGGTYLWNTRTGQVTAILVDPESSGVRSVAFSPDGTTLATGDSEGNTYLWNIRTGKTFASLPASGGSGAVFSVAFAPDGTTLATGDYDGNAYLWNITTGRVTAKLPGSEANDIAYSVAFAPDGTTLAVGHYNRRTYLWNIKYHNS